jgi:hypothetical protein
MILGTRNRRQKRNDGAALLLTYPLLAQQPTQADVTGVVGVGMVVVYFDG